MTRKCVWCLLGLCLLNSGCHFVRYFFYNMTLEPYQHFDDRVEVRRNRELADLAWQQVVAENCDGAILSKDYACGFHTGYEEYLYAGGTGEAPAVPPPRYWNIYHQTPDGHQAIEDWFAGYRHGSQAARESGYREQVLVPLSRPILVEENSFAPRRDRNDGETEQAPAPRVLPPQPDAAATGAVPGNRLPQ